MPKYFGTDGIRGPVGVLPLTPEFVLKLGWAIGSILPYVASKKKVLIGKDTRLSGYLFESALEAGLSSTGTDILLLGPMPTSAIAYLTYTLNAQIGIVISASHNANTENGIKFFSSQGYKLSKTMEDEIERKLLEPLVMQSSELLGKAYRIHDAPGRYIEFCKSSVRHHSRLSQFKIVIDCANGASYHIAPKVFSELGADVITINDRPNGTNINENCGSLYPEELSKRVLAEKADLGIAFDGDGDRVIMVDHLGEVVDGDEIIYMGAKYLLDTDRFSGGVVGTLMSNQGLEVALNKINIPFVRTKVGDQYVIEELHKRKWILGGENSGHVIYLNINTTSDGIITALQILQALLYNKKTLHELKNGMTKFPQRSVSIAYKENRISLEHPLLVKEIEQAENKLKPHGRILLRYSGTEPVIRLMVEDEDGSRVDDVMTTLSHVVTELIDEN